MRPACQSILKELSRGLLICLWSADSSADGARLLVRPAWIGIPTTIASGLVIDQQQLVQCMSMPKWALAAVYTQACRRPASRYGLPVPEACA